MIKKNKDNFPVKMICRLLLVSKSGYYGWQNRKSSKRSEEKIQLTAEINRIFDEKKSRAGSTHQLRD